MHCYVDKIYTCIASGRSEREENFQIFVIVYVNCHIFDAGAFQHISHALLDALLLASEPKKMQKF